MNILVINCGSSSLKYQVIDSGSEEVLAKGLCERIGLDGRLVYQKAGGEKEITEADMPSHKQAIQMVLDALVNPLGRRGIEGHRGMQRFGSAAQPGKFNRRPRLPGTDAKRAYGRRV